MCFSTLVCITFKHVCITRGIHPCFENVLNNQWWNALEKKKTFCCYLVFVQIWETRNNDFLLPKYRAIAYPYLGLHSLEPLPADIGCVLVDSRTIRDYYYYLNPPTEMAFDVFGHREDGGKIIQGKELWMQVHWPRIFTVAENLTYTLITEVWDTLYNRWT